MNSTLIFVFTLGATFSLALASSSSAEFIPIPGGMSGKGFTTSYWDCCKPGCAWSGNLPNTTKEPVRSCNIDGITTIDKEAMSGCGKDGTSFMCIDQAPWNVNKTMSYGFAAFSHEGGNDSSKCCSCMLLKYLGKLLGKTMVIQVTNSGSDLLGNQFDIAVPGGGVGLCNGCTKQFNAPEDGWGERYGGVHTKEECKSLPDSLSEQCKWRFDFWEDVPSPPVEFVEVECPKVLTDISGCYP